MLVKSRGSETLASFNKGYVAGAVTLAFGFVVRLGGFAPFPPESALVAFFSIIPESIQEPAVQRFGEAAGLIGLVAALLISAAVYGIFGIILEKFYLPRVGAVKSLSQLEKFLLYSIIPWLFFGLAVFPAAGESLFGVASRTALPDIVWIFPFTFLLLQMLYTLILSLSYRSPRILPAEPSTEMFSGKTTLQEMQEPRNATRRTFIERGVVIAGSLLLLAASLSTATGALLSESNLLSKSTKNVKPGTSINLQSAPVIFNDARLQALVDSEVTSNDAFYRVAIDVFDPSVNVSTWTLQLAGLVANAKSYSMADLENLSKVEQYTTFECISNEINGNLISNAKWTGVRLSDLFKDASGISPEAKHVVFRSVDGYSVGIPVQNAMMQDSILAYKMNDEPLPRGHGYPLRAVVPGIYGMMSAKWINKIEVVDSTYRGYWQTRGWTNDARVNTVSFIRIPNNGDNVSLSNNNGSVLLGGMAFAGNRGVSKVEVSVDEGRTWQPAQLKPPISNLTWALWAFDWHPTSPGRCRMYARATDGTGALQTASSTDTFPNGATGYTAISVNVVP